MSSVVGMGRGRLWSSARTCQGCRSGWRGSGRPSPSADSARRALQRPSRAVLCSADTPVSAHKPVSACPLSPGRPLQDGCRKEERSLGGHKGATEEACHESCGGGGCGRGGMRTEHGHRAVLAAQDEGDVLRLEQPFQLVLQLTGHHVGAAVRPQGARERRDALDDAQLLRGRHARAPGELAREVAAGVRGAAPHHPRLQPTLVCRVGAEDQEEREEGRGECEGIHRHGDDRTARQWRVEVDERREAVIV
eukprot:4122400-Prymnesium_polylepis.2